MQVLLVSFWVVWVVILLWVYVMLVVFCVDGVLFDLFFRMCVVYDVVYIDVWQVNLVWINCIDWYYVFYFYDVDFVGYCVGWVEVVCGFVEYQVVSFVGFLGFDQCYVGVQCGFYYVVFVVEFVGFFVFGYYCVVVGGGEECWNICVIGM